MWMIERRRAQAVQRAHFTHTAFLTTAHEG
jgi:hypothetical protein